MVAKNINSYSNKDPLEVATPSQEDMIKAYSNEVFENSYQLEHIGDWYPEIDKKTGEQKSTWTIVYFPDRLAARIIEVEKLHNTELGIYIFNGAYYELITKKNNPIYHILNKNYGHESHNDNIARTSGVPRSLLPQKKINASFRTELMHSILEGKLPMKSKDEHFNVIPLESDDFRLCLKNGLYNFTTKKLEPFTSDYMTTNQIQTNYIDISQHKDLLKIYDEWVQYIKSVVDTKDSSKNYYALLKEVVSTALLNVASIKENLWLKGPSGSGKTQFMKIIQFILGEKNYSSVKLHELDPKTGDKYSGYDLMGKTCNFSADTKAIQLDDIEKYMNIKNDSMRIRQIYQEANNNAIINQLWIVSINQFPKGDYKLEDKFLNRMALIMFKHVFKNEKKEIKNYADVWNTPERKSVILYWLLEGLQTLRTTGFTWTQPMDDKLLLINQEGMESFFIDTLEDNTMLDINEFPTIDSRILYERYIDRAQEFGLQYIDSTLFLRRFNSFIKYNYPKATKKRMKNFRQDKKLYEHYYIYSGFSFINGDNKKVLKVDNTLDNKIISYLSYDDVILSLAKKSENHTIRSDILMKELANKGFNNATKIMDTIIQLLQSGRLYDPGNDTFVWITDSTE